jgi:hypothetical protein
VIGRAAAAVALAACLAGCGVPAPTSPPALDVGGTATTATASPLVVAMSDATRPTRIRIPAISAESSLTKTVGVDAANVIQVPDVAHPEQAAWYRYSVVPGQLGPAVIVGHINGGGHQGVFAHLAEVKPGDTAEVTLSNHKVLTFTVQATALPAKTAFPTQAVYGDTRTAALRLLSCGGRLDRAHHRYLDQVIVFADLTAVRDSP